MKLSIIFYWAGDVYYWYGKWLFPSTPSPGDTLNMRSFLDDNLIKADCEDIVFYGLGKYKGIEVSMEGLLSGYFDVKISTINWRSNGIAIEITTDKYMEKMLLEIIFGKKRANKMPGLYIGKEYERKAIQKGYTRSLPPQS